MTSYIDLQFYDECSSTYVGFVTVSYPGDLVIAILSFHNTSPLIILSTWIDVLITLLTN
jgi:hypothetical protein